MVPSGYRSAPCLRLFRAHWDAVLSRTSVEHARLWISSVNGEPQHCSSDCAGDSDTRPGHDHDLLHRNETYETSVSGNATSAVDDRVEAYRRSQVLERDAGPWFPSESP